MSRSRNYAFTINNPKRGEAEQLELYLKTVKYAIIAAEIGESGTFHIQGYLHLSESKPIRFLSKQPGLSRAHIEPCYAGSKSNIDYCKKGGSYLVYGTKPRQGHRSDLDIIRDDILDGAGDMQIADNHFAKWCQYRRAFREYREMKCKVSDTQLILYDPVDPTSCKVAATYMKGRYKVVDVFGLYSSLWLDLYSGNYESIICTCTDDIKNTAENAEINFLKV